MVLIEPFVAAHLDLEHRCEHLAHRPDAGSCGCDWGGGFGLDGAHRSPAVSAATAAAAAVGLVVVRDAHSDSHDRRKEDGGEEDQDAFAAPSVACFPSLGKVKDVTAVLADVVVVKVVGVVVAASARDRVPFPPCGFRLGGGKRIEVFPRHLHLCLLVRISASFLSYEWTV